jgi:DNA-binding response OmpR family regulator
MSILIVTDDPDTRKRLGDLLRREGYTVRAARGREGLPQARAHHPQLVLLDPRLAAADGFASYHALCADGGIPLLTLAGASVDGPRRYPSLSASAEARDALHDLLTRVRTLLHRADAPAGEPVQFGPLLIDPAERTALLHGQPLTLRAKEFDLLLAFARHPGEVLARERLLEEAWGYSVAGKTRTVDMHVAHLRPKLAGSGLAIQTRRGAGYLLVHQPEDAEPTPLHSETD